MKETSGTTQAMNTFQLNSRRQHRNKKCEKNERRLFNRDAFVACVVPLVHICFDINTYGIVLLKVRRLCDGWPLIVRLKMMATDFSYENSKQFTLDQCSNFLTQP